MFPPVGASWAHQVGYGCFSAQNKHGFRGAITRSTVVAESPPRAPNLCARTRLPRLDGVGEAGTDEGQRQFGTGCCADAVADAGHGGDEHFEDGELLPVSATKRPSR